MVIIKQKIWKIGESSVITIPKVLIRTGVIDPNKNIILKLLNGKSDI